MSSNRSKGPRARRTFQRRGWRSVRDRSRLGPSRRGRSGRWASARRSLFGRCFGEATARRPRSEGRAPAPHARQRAELAPGRLRGLHLDRRRLPALLDRLSAADRVRRERVAQPRGEIDRRLRLARALRRKVREQPLDARNELLGAPPARLGVELAALERARVELEQPVAHARRSAGRARPSPPGAGRRPGARPSAPPAPGLPGPREAPGPPAFRGRAPRARRRSARGRRARPRARARRGSCSGRRRGHRRRGSAATPRRRGSS